MSSLTKILILAAFANGLSWIILIPIWQYPDEQSHFAQVQGIAELGGIPETGYDTTAEVAISEKLLGTERDSSGNNRFTYNPYYHIDYTAKGNGLYEDFITNLPIETRLQYVKREATHNPPLYHMMASNFYNIFSPHSLFARVYAVRIFSVLLYLGLIVFSINFSKMAFKNDKGAQACFPALIAFAPMVAFSTTGVLPDPLTILLFSAILTVGLKIITYRLNLILLFLLIILVILGTFTRQQFQIALAISLVALLHGLYRMFPQKGKLAFWLFLIIIAVAVSVLVRLNPALVVIPEIGAPNLTLIFSGDFAQYLNSTLRHYYSQTLPWYWGVYKWLSLTVPHIYYQTINRIIALSLVGLAVWVILKIRSRKIDKQDTIMAFLTVSIFIYFSIFIIWDFYFQRTYGYSFGVQGRYFLVLVLPITAVLLFGLREIFIRFHKNYLSVLYFLLALAMVLFNDISLSFVASTYYDAGNLKTLINQISQYKPVILKGNIIFAIVLLGFFSQVVYLLKLFRQLKINHESS